MDIEGEWHAETEVDALLEEIESAIQKFGERNCGSWIEVDQLAWLQEDKNIKVVRMIVH